MSAHTLSLIQPDDWHLHLRDGDLMSSVLPFSSAIFARAIVMPNLNPPITQINQAVAYKRRIKSALPGKQSFQPLMTLYLRNDMDSTIVQAAKKAGIVAFKLYPQGVTTNSSFGVRNPLALISILETMAEEGIILLVHGEVAQPHVDIFDREAVFIEQFLLPIRERLPTLKIVLEHITTVEGVDFVQTYEHVAGTVTPQHLLFNRNQLFMEGLRPHHYCLPILKREYHRQALIKAVTSSRYRQRFFLGTDSAPHLRHHKEAQCGCAGIFNAIVAISVYAQIFEEAHQLVALEGFASLNGPRFYGLPVNSSRIKLIKKPWQVPEFYAVPGGELVPLLAGQTLAWQVSHD